MDPSLGRFTSPDTLVPTGTQGTQAWDRYAFVNNNPVRYNDPTGHDILGWDSDGFCGNFCSGAAKVFDVIGVGLAAAEALIVDAFAAHVIAAGCLTGVGCGPAIGAAVAVDGLVASYASPVGGAENVFGLIALGFTAADDISNGSTYLNFNAETGELILGLGQNTAVSATTNLLGHFPESNFDLSVSVTQAVYDFTLGEQPTTLVEFVSDPIVPPEPHFMDACIPKPGNSCSE